MDSIGDLMGTAALIVVTVVAALMSSRALRARLKSVAGYIMNRYPRTWHLQDGRIPPGSFGLPIIGESLQFIFSYRSEVYPDRFMDERRSRYGPIFTTHLFGKPTVVSLDAEVNRLILNSEGRLFFPEYPTTLKQLWGEMAIIMLSGSLHKRIHGIVSTFLKSEELKDNLLVHTEAFSRQAMDNWSTKRTVFVEEETKKITFQVTAKLMLGLDSREASEAKTTEAFRAEFHKFIAGVASVPINLPGFTFYSSLRSRARMIQIIKDLMKEKERKGETLHSLDGAYQESGGQIDILDVLIEEWKNMNAKEDGVDGKGARGEAMPVELITDNIVAFFFPSEDSVGMLLTLAVKYISECPDALQQLREENLDFSKRFAGKKLSSRDYLMELPFTHCVLNETLRVGNIVKGLIRRALVDVHVKGFVIPKGWAVFPFFRGVHLEEGTFEDAHVFNPWRWREKVSQLHFTPFGGGTRHCPGLENSRLMAAVFLHQLVTRFEWEPKGKDTLTHFPFVKFVRKLPIHIVRELEP